MGGTIWVESEQYVGSTFHFTLVAPVIKSDDVATLPYALHPALAERTALVVDDNPTTRQFLQQTLQVWGMQPTLAASGAEALARVREQPHFDLLILDMQMPGMAGMALAREMRKLMPQVPIVMTSALGVPMYAAGDNRQLQDLPIVITSPGSWRTSVAAGQNDPQEAMRQMGANSILLKPLKPSLLRATLLEQLDRSVLEQTRLSETTPGGAERSSTGQGGIAPSEELHRLDTVAQVARTQGTEETTNPQPTVDPNMATHYPLRILLVEDNFTNQKVAQRMLMRLGYSADVAVNGIEAVNAVRRQPYDLILMDVQMPEMDGLEATRHIRADLTIVPQPYIIAMTAAAMTLDRDQCLAAGMDDFLAKPTRLEELIQAFQRARPLAVADDHLTPRTT
jgi:CheY-like chemotaxis protein